MKIVVTTKMEIVKMLQKRMASEIAQKLSKLAWWNMVGADYAPDFFHKYGTSNI